MLVLDEPTNDLDIESLELLEAALQDYSGTLLLVSHDPAFRDNVVTSVLAPERDGKWKEYAGGYTDWLRQRPAAAVEEKPAAKAPAREKARSKLSYKESRKLEALPREIEALEAEQKALGEKMGDPHYFRQVPHALRAHTRRSDEIEALLAEKLERWQSLEAKAKSAR